jgi:electron transfer flavoprotein alpha subunit
MSGPAHAAGAVLVLVDHDRGRVDPASLQAITFARTLVPGAPVAAVVVGGDAAPAVAGADEIRHVRHDELSDFAPEAWGDALHQVATATAPAAVVATGTERGNEVLAHVAALAGEPFAANVVEATPGDPWRLRRVRWGGSLLEDATLTATLPILSCTPHAFTAPAAATHTAPVHEQRVDLPRTAGRTRVVERVQVSAGLTLASAPVVVSGGRGVGSEAGFAALEELAGLLGGVVGCSRVVTNQGWRPHADQVGQTGKRVAPDLYVACGISGAIQHWVGMQAAKCVLAINTDRDAPMVAKADYAVIGDLHEIVPAIVDELKSRHDG